MATVTHKSYSLHKALNAFTGVDTEKSIQNDVCVLCGKPAQDFRDALSQREFSISGMCQDCQDKTFGS
jgi:uncharacterized CHY-type Zn-finger protein